MVELQLDLTQNNRCKGPDGDPSGIRSDLQESSDSYTELATGAAKNI